MPIKKLLNWLDQHILELTAGFLLAFVPLYPKWPLFDILPGYIVRIRLDDFAIAVSILILAVQVIRRRTNLRINPLFLPILLYLFIGLLSSLSALFITRTVPLELPHIGKLLLHWGRRVEYMSVALLFFAAVSTKENLKRLLTIFVITAALVGLYGFGQKYLAWPVYTTMNREFSKGWRLVLTENARVSSTFAGHYDLAAYTVVALSVLAAFLMVAPKKTKFFYATVFIITFAMLLLTASRSSFLAYLPAITIVAVLLATYLKPKTAITWWLVLMVVSGVGVRSFGGLYSRFAHLLMFDRLHAYVQEFTSQFKPQAQRDLEISQDLSLVYTPSDTPPSPVSTPAPDLANLPPDVDQAIPLSYPEASLSAIPDTTGTGNEGKPRTYSDAAYTFGLSSAIRFDVLWPKAIAGFKKNPLLGTGYSTLLKDNVTDFTEAESTDNDYLRSLGETGLLGVLSFYGIFIYALYLVLSVWRRLKDRDMVAFAAAFVAGITGLLINALYIDVFEASKIAYITWAFLGMAAGLVVFTLHHQSPKKHVKKTR